jgi:hypothetical protein
LFRNQQVAGSIPAGGSMLSVISAPFNLQGSSTSVPVGSFPDGLSIPGGGRTVDGLHPAESEDSVAYDFPDRLNLPGCGNPVNPGQPADYIKLSCFAAPIPATRPNYKSPKSTIVRSQLQVFRSCCESLTLETEELCNGYFRVLPTDGPASVFCFCGCLQALR